MAVFHQRGREECRVAKPGRKEAFNIEVLYAGLQSSYWLGVCIFSGFMAVYLGYYGFSDPLIGFTSSLISLITVAFQLFVSSYQDKHSHIPIKRTASYIYLAVLVLAALLALVPLPIVLMLLVYSLAGGLVNAIPGLYNALIMQFVNLGLPVNLGWPRGISAIAYALAAFFLGLALERYEANILMPLCLAAFVIALVFILVMPKPENAKGAMPPVRSGLTGNTSFRQLLGSNKVLQLFLLASVVMNAGQSNTQLFLPRIIAFAGGTKSDLGLALFIQVGAEMPGMALTPWLLRRYRARAILTISFASYLAKMIIVLFSKSMPGILSATAVSLMCFGLYGISSVYFVNDIVQPQERIRAQVLVSMSGALAAIFANPLAGVIVERFGVHTLNIICVICQAMGLGLMLLCAALQNHQEQTPAAVSA